MPLELTDAAGMILVDLAASAGRVAADAAATRFANGIGFCLKPKLDLN